MRLWPYGLGMPDRLQPPGTNFRLAACVVTAIA